jgi:DNA-3-methyladenine glycosylase I
VKDHGSLDAYLWNFVDGKQIINHPDIYKNLPASTEISEKLSKSLKKYGFTFVGPTICYAFMQAA